MSYKNIPVVIVAGIGADTRALGKDNKLLFHVPDDLKRFKELTSGKPIIMGRKTFESILEILGKPLPNRTNIVVTRDKTYNHEGIVVTHSLEEAFSVASQEQPEEIHIGGGAEIYRQALPYVDKLHLTLFESDLEGDTFFPEYAGDFKEIARDEPREHNGLKYQWVDLERK